MGKPAVLCSQLSSKELETIMYSSKIVAAYIVRYFERQYFQLFINGENL